MVAGRCLTHIWGYQMSWHAPLMQVHICTEVLASSALGPQGAALQARPGREKGAQGAQWQQKWERGMQVQQLHLFAVGKVVNFSFPRGAETEGFAISAELALGCLPQATAAVSAQHSRSQGAELSQLRVKEGCGL